MVAKKKTGIGLILVNREVNAEEFLYVQNHYDYKVNSKSAWNTGKVLS